MGKVLSKSTSKRQKLEMKAMEYWSTYGEKYRNLKTDYKEVLDQILAERKERWPNMSERDMKRDLRPLNQSVLDNLPEIEFFKLSSEKEAKTFLAKKTEKQLEYLVEEEITNAICVGYEYNTIRGKIMDYKHILKLENAVFYDATGKVSGNTILERRREHTSIYL